MKSKTMFAATFLIGALALAGMANAASGAPDWTITLKVKLELLSKLGVDALKIDVDTDAGNVHLSGTVEKRATKELAGTIAQAVDGVQAVDNDLQLESTESSRATAAMNEAENEVKDGILESKVKLALLEKLGTDGFAIGTEVASGVVTLEFNPSLDDQHRDLAKHTAEGVDGVTKVITVEKE